MKIGLFFGSFNPIHIGHLAIADYMYRHGGLDQIWLVVSPHNPLKEKKYLADARKRLLGVKKAIGRNSKIKVSDIEFRLPQPSYTINTLDALKKKHPRNKFTLIIGSDNLNLFHKWKDYRKILNSYKIYVYPRILPLNKGGKRGLSMLLKYPGIKLFNAPLLNISSTFIREQVRKGENVKNFLPV